MKSRIKYIALVVFLLSIIFIMFRTIHNSNEKVLYDNANILGGLEDYTENYIKNNLEARYSIEMVVLTLKSMPKEEDINVFAHQVFNNRQIGKNYGGRGLLLLFIEDKKQVKLEVSMRLEDVFTDGFCGYIEDIQLKPAFTSGNLGRGLVSVMEEIDKRALIKNQNDYTPEMIKELDDELLSAGGGTLRKLEDYEANELKPSNNKYPPGKTPDEAWKTLLKAWKDGETDSNLGVYTEITKLAYRDYENRPASALERDYNTWKNRPYEIIQNKDYAVVFFGNKKGWDNAPFLLCRTDEGWKFDIVHQRRFIRMGRNPLWGIERSVYPYIELLSKCPYFQGQDIPVEPEDLYRVENDKVYADRIRTLEAKYKNNPGDLAAAMELGRLYTITQLSLKAIPLLKKVKNANPENPLPYKYLSMAYVQSTYSYESALEELEQYLKLEPYSVFGHNYIGYLYYQLNDYKNAEKHFKQALKLDNENCYSLCKLSRIHETIYFDRAKNACVGPDKIRIKWLKYAKNKNK